MALRAFAKGQLKCQVVVARDGVEAIDYLLGTGAGTEPAAPLPASPALDVTWSSSTAEPLTARSP